MPKPIIHIIDEDSEADTCRKYVLPKLKDESYWTDEQIMEQRPFTAGKIIVIGRIGILLFKACGLLLFAARGGDYGKPSGDAITVIDIGYFDVVLCNLDSETVL